MDQYYRESFIFSVGETKMNTVEFTIYQPSGMLSILVIKSYTSWHKYQKKIAVASIEEIKSEEHGITISCFDYEQEKFFKLCFFGSEVQIDCFDVKQVIVPKLFGHQPAKEYKRKYFVYFNDSQVRKNLLHYQ